MALSPKTRSLLLISTLSLTLAAVFMAPQPEVEAMETVQPAMPKVRAIPASFKADDHIPDIVITRPGDGSPKADPFANKVAVSAKPAEQEAVAPPPAPTAPPLPYAYLGKMMEDGKTVIFFGKQENSYSAKIGETLEGLYRVDEISEQAVTLVYLPLDKKQTLPIGRDVN